MEDIVLQTHWGWQIALYLFLGGLAAGTLCVSAVINLLTKDRFKKTIRFGAWAGTILLILGVLLLLIDLTMPMRGILLWKSFVNLDSWMAFGAWFLFAGIIFAGIYALSGTGWITRKIRFLSKLQSVLAVIIIPVSIGIAIYTGILLGVLVSHPLWNTWLLPALFTVSALDTGVALVSGYATLRESKEQAGLFKLKRTLEISTVILIVLEVIVLAIFLATVSSSGDVANTSVQILTSGQLSLYFWILFIGLGLAIPLIVSAVLIMRHEIAEKTRNALPLVAISLCLVGGCALRFLILLAGLPVHA
jgi:formate-dependent nitrite reductase membrane component NrfD